MPKKTRGLNDTAAIQSMPIDPVQKNESMSLSIRKISNGYITSEHSSKDGLYESSETFSHEPPGSMSDDAGADSPLAKAVRYMTRTGTV